MDLAPAEHSQRADGANSPVCSDRYRLNRFKSAPIVWMARSSVSGLGIGILK